MKHRNHNGNRAFTPAQREAAFWSKVDKSAGPAACWPWRGAITSHGYGCVCAGGLRVIGAHKAAYQYAKGEIPAGMETMHSCDNPPCCNPAHLSIGTRQDNMTDKAMKGRTSKQRVTKLNVIAVREIRGLKGIEGSGSIARRFGVSQSHIITIWSGRVWRNA